MMRRSARRHSSRFSSSTVSNGGGVFSRVVGIFLEQAPITLEELQRAAGTGDAVGVARAAHSLKSASLNVGAESMANLSKELELLGKHGTTEGVVELATPARRALSGRQGSA